MPFTSIHGNRLGLGEEGELLVDGQKVATEGGETTEPTGADIVLTGYAAGTAGAVAATDSVNAAIAKLEARLAALEAV